MRDAARRWREQLEAWAIPEEILRAVPDSPWALPREVFVRRADSYVEQPVGASYQRAREALEPAGSVLDVGAGAGAASLPLAPHLTELIAVDERPSMMDDLTERAGRLATPVRTIVGRWPDVAPETPEADVVVCHHVAYNVADLDMFVAGLANHARRRVVLELTAQHPMAALNPLWTVMHGLERPTRPTVDDALEVLREIGIEPTVQRWPRPVRAPYPSFDALVTTTRRRICLPADREAELARVLLDLGADRDHPRDLPPPDNDLVTLWWDR